MTDNEARLSSFIADKAKQVASLKQDGKSKDPKSRDKFASSPFASDSTVDRIEPPKDQYRRYWRQFETTPIVREPITSFSRQVVEPGYRVESPDLDEEQLRKLINWLRNAAVIEGLTDQNMTSFIKKAVVQREVKGTVFIEKVGAKEKKDTLLGFKFIPPETMEVNKRPNQNIVLQPGDESEFEDVPTTKDGTAAAYTQIRPGQSGYASRSAGGSGSKEIYFTANEVIKLTRDADIGEALGTSRLESVSQRIEGLKNKLRDNDEAISSKAYPLWLFLFGSEDAPWDRDDIDNFMRSHEMENFHPGMKQGVRGDVDVKTISGEVADIAEYLDFDLNWILTAMPKAKYTLGAFESKINKFVTQSQERDTKRQVKEARREIEGELTPAVQQKAKEMFGISDEAVENIRFKLGSPDEEKISEEPNVNVIRYIGGDTETVNPNQQDPQGGPQDQQKQNQQQQQQQQSDSDEDKNVASEQGKAIWEAELSHEGHAEELADPRLVSTTDEESDLSSVIHDVFMDFRQNVLTELESEYTGTPESAVTVFPSMANAKVDNEIRNANLRDKSNSIMESVVQDALDTLGQRNQSLSMDVEYGFRHQQQAKGYSQNVVQSTRDALHEFVRRMRLQLERGVNNGEDLNTITSRIRNQFNDSQLTNRSDVVARMEIQNAVESAKLNEFDNHEDIVAVKPINACTDSTTRLCENLAGCGRHSPAVARLDEELSDQWDNQVPDRLTFAGFTPLPANPPWHFGCRSELVPLTEEELEEHEPSEGGTYTVEELEEKYDIKVEE